MLAQIVADQLGGAIERIVVRAGDSGQGTMGFGGFNSRQAVVAGSSAHAAAVKVREKILLAAGHLLEVDAGDLDIAGDRVVLTGATDLSLSLAEIARTMAGAPGFVLPGNLPPGLEATENVVLDQMTYANGTAVAEVEVDVKTAAVKVTRIVFVHDAGRLINPTIVEGQIAGGIAHGIGNALYEWMAYDDAAQPLTTTLADYLLLTAAEMPALDLAHRETPTPLNALGVKGIGEAGVLPIPAAIISAVEDALSPSGIRLSQFPIRLRDLAALLATAGLA